MPSALRRYWDAHVDSWKCLRLRRQPRHGRCEEIDAEPEAHPDLSPAPLPTKRLRALTLPIQVEDEAEDVLLQHTVIQEASPLLSRLPLEIRQMIYREALGDGLLHIVNIAGRLTHLKCNIEDPVIRLLECWRFEGEEVRYKYHNNPDYSVPSGLLGLLKTCRQVYSEAIDTLYSQNTFDLNHPQTVIHLSTTSLPQRFHAIASLRLSWFFLRAGQPYDLSTWDECCAVIATMKGLKDLRVTVAGLWIDNNPSAMKILDPLRAVNTPAVFQVEGPWSWDFAVEFSDAPFDLITLDQRWRETQRSQSRERESALNRP